MMLNQKFKQFLCLLFVWCNQALISHGEINNNNNNNNGEGSVSLSKKNATSTKFIEEQDESKQQQQQHQQQLFPSVDEQAKVPERIGIEQKLNNMQKTLDQLNSHEDELSTQKRTGLIGPRSTQHQPSYQPQQLSKTQTETIEGSGAGEFPIQAKMETDDEDLEVWYDDGSGDHEGMEVMGSGDDPDPFGGRTHGQGPNNKNNNGGGDGSIVPRPRSGHSETTPFTVDHPEDNNQDHDIDETHPDDVIHDPDVIVGKTGESGDTDIIQTESNQEPPRRTNSASGIYYSAHFCNQFMWTVFLLFISAAPLSQLARLL